MPLGRLLHPFHDFSDLFWMTVHHKIHPSSVLQWWTCRIVPCIVNFLLPGACDLWPFRAGSFPVIVPSVDRHARFLFLPSYHLNCWLWHIPEDRNGSNFNKRSTVKVRGKIAGVQVHQSLSVKWTQHECCQAFSFLSSAVMIKYKIQFCSLSGYKQLDWALLHFNIWLVTAHWPEQHPDREALSNDCFEEIKLCSIHFHIYKMFLI